MFASLEKPALDDFPINRDKLACGSNRKDFLTSSSLVFRLTEQGRFGNCDFGQSLYVK